MTMAIKSFYHPIHNESAALLRSGRTPPALNTLLGILNFSLITKNGKPLRAQAALFPFSRKKDRTALKEKLFEAIAPLDRGSEAFPQDQILINQIAQELETANPTKEPLRSPLLNGKWELLYTTSEGILKRQRPKFLRPNGPIYQAINIDTLRAQNVETWPFFNQVTANLSPLSGQRVSVNFDKFKIAGLVFLARGSPTMTKLLMKARGALGQFNVITLVPCYEISINAPPQARGELEITFLDDKLRISRGDKGNLFVLKMVDPTYRVPL